MSDICIPTWRSLLDKSLYKCKHQPESRYFQLATQRLDGSLANRTVVFRGYGSDNNLLLFTDMRSKKWSEIRKKPKVAICWYLSETREQYRIDGKGEFLNSAEFNQQIEYSWQSLSNIAKSQFLWGEPGSKRNSSNSLRISANMIPDKPPEHFCLLSIRVDKVDYLNLKGDPQHRVLHTKNTRGHWTATELIP